MRLYLKVFSAAALLLAAADHGTADDTKTKPVANINATNYFTISGMTCEGCSSGLASELKRVPGVAFAQVSLTNKLATVKCDTNRVSEKELLNAIKEAGFGGKPVSR